MGTDTVTTADDEARAFTAAMEVFSEVESIADLLLAGAACGDLDRYAARTFGTRLRQLVTLGQAAIDNSAETSMLWSDFWGQLTGVMEASHG